MSQVGDLASHVNTKIADLSQPCLKMKRSPRQCERSMAGKTTCGSRANANSARAIWGELPKITLRGLKELCARHDLSVAAGDLQLL